MVDGPANVENDLADAVAFQADAAAPAAGNPAPAARVDAPAPAPAPAPVPIPAPAPVAAPADNNFNLARVGIGLFARNILSSLLAPLMGQVVGSMLHQWSLASSLPGATFLQRILGTGRGGRIGSRPGSGGWIRQRIGFGSPVMPIGLQLGLEELDPIW